MPSMRTTSFFLLTVLCLALTVSAQTIIYSEGPIDGTTNSFFVTGPNLPNFLGSVQDISNGFVAANTAAATHLEWGEWSVGAPTSFAYSLSASAFGNELGGGTVAQNAGNSTLLFTNGYGYGVYDVKVPISSSLMTAGSIYWLSISNATDASADGTQGWDIPGYPVGGPATCNFRQSGTNYGGCGVGGESFTLGACCVPPVPEPSSILLFGSGILGVAGILRRKLNR